MKNNFIGFVGVLLMVFVFTACGSSSSGTGTTVAADTTTSTAVPTDVVLTSPTATTSASSSISVGKADAPPQFTPKGDKPGDPQGEDFESRKQAFQTLVNGSGECAFTLSLPTVESPDCYGPIVSYISHPDATGGGQPADGNLPPGDTGIWSALEGSQACSAAKMNELVGKVSSKADNMVNIFGVMACAGKKASVALPAVNATVDMKDVMTSNMSVTGLTVSDAALKRLADDSNGNAVYLSTITMDMSLPGISASQTSDIILKHIPTATDNSTYKGKISMKMTVPKDSQEPNCSDFFTNNPTATKKLVAVVIAYEKASSTSLKYKVDYAEFCDSSADPFDANNNIDPSNKFSWPGTPSGWANNYNYGIFNVNPTDGTGTVEYAWQAGANDQRTRVLNIATSVATSVGSGTAYYGYGPDVTGTGVGSIDGFVCNWTGPGGATGAPGNDRSAANLLAIGRGQNLAQKQVITRAAGATIFTPTSSEITYAPTNNCNATAGGTFTYANTTGTAMDNDRAATTNAVTNNLIALTDIVFTAPTAPTDVGGSS